MRILDGELICSASDLVGFAACRHLTRLELSAARGEIERPTREDPFVDVLSRRGGDHERDVRATYDPADVADVAADTRTRAGLEAAASDTIRAMRAGARVIYQATFLHDAWVGHADFVERVDTTPSDLGSWSYRAVDAKLARSVKASAIVQLADYSEHLTRIQGVAPEHIVVVTGDGERHCSRLADAAAYHRALKDQFRAAVLGEPAATYPDPIAHCSMCRWADVCDGRRHADDHLSLVAGMRADHSRELAEAGIRTRRDLADGPLDPPCDGIRADVYSRLRAQAALQVRGQGVMPPLFELLEPEADPDGARPRGLAALPVPSPGDLFLDLEGDPLALDGGLEYLFGVVEVVDGAHVYHPFWAHTRAEERAAFEAAVDFVVRRRTARPDLHVYHYASYEPSAFKRLMGAHGTREDEVDELLRGEVFVDLFRSVRQSVRLSTESYSLKAVERLYLPARDGAVMDAGASIVAYEEYLEQPDARKLDDIAAYNRDDCESLVFLRQWLEARRLDAMASFGPFPRPDAPEAQPRDEQQDDRAALAARLAARSPAEALLGNLLEWHRREAKPAWWRFFARRHDYEPHDFARDRDCIGGLELVGEVSPDGDSTVSELRFEPQDHKFSPGARPVDPATGRQAGEIVAIGDDRVMLRRARRRADEPFPEALMPGGPYDTRAQRAAVLEVGAWVAEHGLDGPGPYRAARDLLLRAPPRGAGAVADVLALDRGCLPVQGPPGAGKTHTGASMIVSLLGTGRRVGVTATTHSAIGNLLEKIAEAAAQAHLPFHAMQKADDDKACGVPGVECTNDSSDVEDALRSGDLSLAAGTAWLWSREGLRGSVDVLVIDEAGQMSLADVVAVSTAAGSVVLLGDPQQLAHPSQGWHPDGAGVSALRHVLGERDTIAADRGRFLDTTWRMHPNVCRFISEIAYDGRLHSEPDLAEQSVDGDAGLWWVPVVHKGDAVRSRDEAEAVAGLVGELIGTPWVDRCGVERPLTPTDLIVVVPYNAHVAEVHRALRRTDVPVGTVDKFQGREGAVAIYSMASSSADDAPRGTSFLYDLHRLNVAVSRARARAYVVASPTLLRVLCRTPHQIRLVNALCRYVESARR